MKHIYFVEGLYCAACREKVEKALKLHHDIVSAQVDLKKNQLTLEMRNNIALAELNAILKPVGDYKIIEQPPQPIVAPTKIQNFLPLIIIFTLILMYTGFQQGRHGFNLFEAMNDFMGAFFLVFGAFKIINWRGFVESYQTYDILAKRSLVYAYLYPLIEMTLGAAYIFRFNLPVTNAVTIFIMGIGSIGVSQALLSKRRIICACLGAVFKIPMTTVTLLEDVLMFVMALAMLVFYK